MTVRTASCFLHGTYNAALTRCPKCATDALTRRAEKAEAECGRLREQQAEQLEWQKDALAETEVLRQRAARLREKLDAARQALERIAALDPSEWHHGSGWKGVEFIQNAARAALGVVGEQEKTQ